MIESIVSQAAITCPYCGERFEISVEVITEPQTYFQDCDVCCRPMLLEISELNAVGEFSMQIRSDSE